MKSIGVFLIITALVILAVIIIITVWSRLKFHRSFMASVSEFLLQTFSKKYTDEELINNLKNLPLKNDVNYKIPPLIIFSVPVTEYTVFGMQTFYFNENSTSKTVVLYLHGGSYVFQPIRQHFAFLNKIAKRTGLTIVAPLYPKAPNHSYKEAFECVTALYKNLQEKYAKIILMGDSSGGGLALALSEYFLKENIGLPNETILLSPWVDISMDNADINYYEKKDPSLTKNSEVIWGKAYAGELDVKNYKVSPLYGDVIGLNSVKLFVGTRELLYPDIMLLYEKLKKSNVDVTLYKGNGLNHVYPLYPTPEAKTAQKTIVDMINNVK